MKDKDADSLNKLGEVLFAKKVPVTIIITKNPELAKIKKQRIIDEFKSFKI